MHDLRAGEKFAGAQRRKPTAAVRSGLQSDP
jgi:hypothetical protein